MGSIRKHMTYANVAATLALMLAVTGGTAFAIKGKFGAKNLKNNAVTEAKIAPGAVTTQKIAGGAVIGASIADGGVGTGDLAAATVEELDADCPQTLSAFAGICMSGSNGGPFGWQTSAQTCSNIDLVLPDTGEAMTIARNVVPGTQIWTSDLVGTGSDAIVVTGATTNPTAAAEPIANNNNFRCVAPLTD
jgi:hypothetical protein